LNKTFTPSFLKNPSPQLIFWFAILVHAIAAWFSSGFHHPDEHFQIIEFANFKIGNITESQLPWEFGVNMRPGIQPFIFFIFYNTFLFIGLTNPFVITFILRLITSLFAIFTVYQLQKSLKPFFKSTEQEKIHLWLSLFCYALVYFQVRFSSESWSAILYTLAISFVLQKHKHQYILFGLFSGLSFIFRYQSGFFIVGTGLWFLFIDKINIKTFVKITIGFAIAFFIGILFDYWLYNKFVLTCWNYFYQNIFEHKAAQFGTEPWYWYFTQTILHLFPPYGWVILLGLIALIKLQPKNIITWSVFSFIFFHCITAHKEFRFLFPIGFFIPFIVVVFIQWQQQFITGFLKKILFFLAKLFWPLNMLLLLMVIFKPAHELANVYLYLYNNNKPQSLLIYQKQNPYFSGSNQAVFLKPTLLNCISMEQAKTDTILFKKYSTVLYFTETLNDSNVSQNFKSASLVYNNISAWLLYFNVNNWVERSNHYLIYEVKK
jgi:phosphatidylinositol glycan class B